MLLENRIAIVSGIGPGMGRDISLAFAREGAHLVLAARGADKLEEVAAEVRKAGRRALCVPTDIAKKEDCAKLVEAAKKEFGRVDVLVNNAVLWGPAEPDPGASFEAAAEEDWQRVLRVNIEGAVRLSRLVAPEMRRRRWGRLVHISSSIATDGLAGGEYYGAAKAALHGFSRSVAFNLGRDGDILSNVVTPGLTRTDTNGHIVDAAGEAYAALSPLGRLLTAEEVANAVVYLGSAANKGVNGQVVAVTGGS